MDDGRDGDSLFLVVAKSLAGWLLGMMLENCKDFCGALASWLLNGCVAQALKKAKG